MIFSWATNYKNYPRVSSQSSVTCNGQYRTRNKGSTCRCHVAFFRVKINVSYIYYYVQVAIVIPVFIWPLSFIIFWLIALKIFNLIWFDVFDVFDLMIWFDFKAKKNRATFIMNQARCAYYTSHIQEKSFNQRKLFQSTKALLCDAKDISFPSGDPDRLVTNFGNFFVQKIERINSSLADLSVQSQPPPHVDEHSACADGRFTSFKFLTQDPPSYPASSFLWPAVGNERPWKDPIWSPKIADFRLNCACLTCIAHPFDAALI